MSTCTKWVDTIAITCKNWRSQVDYECTTWADEGSSQCSRWADQGSEQCSRWADEGSSRCTSWEECHWYTPWNCIAGFFCRAWSPRTNAPTTLPAVAVNPDPLTCEEDDEETEDGLLIRRSDLRVARRAGIYRDREVAAHRPIRSQIGFLQVALLRVLQISEHPERVQWIEDYKAISTGIDAAIFMAEAKLKVRFGMDVKKMRREGIQESRRRRRHRERASSSEVAG